MPHHKPIKDSWDDFCGRSTSVLAGAGASSVAIIPTSGQVRVALNRMCAMPILFDNGPAVAFSELREMVTRRQKQERAADPQALAASTMEMCGAMCRMPWEGGPLTIADHFQPAD